MLTSENTVSFISLLSLKNALENKVVCRKHFNSPSPLLFRCSESSRQELFWKVTVSNFFVEILERYQGRISFSCCKLEGYIFTTKIVKITGSYQRFQLDSQLATMQGCYFKKNPFFPVQHQ